ncbi:MAG: hypothetical protein IJ435_09040 [Clostridia bacterium]|nr:hypothetical protein [Clostridia bacterium]
MKMRKVMSVIVAVIMLISLLPIHSHAWENEIDCEYCGAFCGDSYICDGGDHCSEESGRDCYYENHCQECGECKSSASGWCDDCHMCLDCAMSNGCHCPDCGVCGVEEALCSDCGRCYETCGGECSEGQDHICLECHYDQGSYACEDCGLCFVNDESLKCLICDKCHECADEWCDECHMCVECAQDNGCHCKDCGACQVDQALCTDCWVCYDCNGECTEGQDHVCYECHLADDMVCPGCGLCFVDDSTVRCIICGYCAECDSPWCQDCYMGVECAMDNGTHCIDCGVCIVDSKLCENCWRCYECGGECSEGDDHYCLECHVEDGEACPDCQTCFIDQYGTSCDSCGICFDCCTDWCDMCNMCYECAANEGLHCVECWECLENVDDYCESCFVCSDCSSGVCADCGECANCVEICPNCEDHCNSCSNVCADCGACENCSDVLECSICNDYYCYSCVEFCPGCGACSSCAVLCSECGNYCSECADLCEECGGCDECVELCEVCGLYCSKCYSECPVCGTSIAIRIDNVSLSGLTIPKEGKTPDFTLSSDEFSKYALVGGSYQPITWWEDGREMSSTDTFKAGKNYSVDIWVYAKNGYVFAVDKTGVNFETKVTATIDGQMVTVRKAYEQSPWEVIELSIDFGECSDEVIEHVIINDVTAPLAGEYPTYFATVKGTGYKINTNKNSYYDAYWVGEKWYYIKNGIGWFDMTDFDWVYENETFIPGHEYQVRIYLATNDGYEFYYNRYYETQVTGTVNGNEAINQTTSWTPYEQEFGYNFTCSERVINQIVIDDLIVPYQGSRPDLEITVDKPNLYQPDPNYGYAYCGVIWYDENGAALGRYEEFEAGKKYRAEVKLVPTKVDGVYMSTFDRNMTVVNVTPTGKMGENVSYPTELYVMNRVAYAYFDYECRESEGTTKLTLNANPSSGSVTIAASLCTDIWQRDPIVRIAFYDKNDIMIHTEFVEVGQGFVTTFALIDIPSGAVRCKAMLLDGKTIEPFYEAQVAEIE